MNTEKKGYVSTLLRRKLRTQGLNYIDSKHKLLKCSVSGVAILYVHGVEYTTYSNYSTLMFRAVDLILQGIY